MIEIEFEDPTFEYCECCGKEMVRLTRFVNQDDNAYAVYYAKFTRGHDKKVLYGLISLGAWGEAPNQKTGWLSHSEFGLLMLFIRLALLTAMHLLGAIQPT